VRSDFACDLDCNFRRIKAERVEEYAPQCVRALCDSREKEPVTERVRERPIARRPVERGIDIEAVADMSGSPSSRLSRAARIEPPRAADGARRCASKPRSIKTGQISAQEPADGPDPRQFTLGHHLAAPARRSSSECAPPDAPANHARLVVSLACRISALAPSARPGILNWAKVFLAQSVFQGRTRSLLQLGQAWLQRRLRVAGAPADDPRLDARPFLGGPHHQNSKEWCFLARARKQPRSAALSTHQDLISGHECEAH
jgi:hypothetical protein